MWLLSGVYACMSKFASSVKVAQINNTGMSFWDSYYCEDSSINFHALARTCS